LFFECFKVDLVNAEFEAGVLITAAVIVALLAFSRS